MIKPTVGRIVLYASNDVDIREHHRLGNDRLAALVVGVQNEKSVNLVVFGADGSMHPRQSVYLSQGDENFPIATPFAHWMDYQKGQAAKTEQLQKQLGGPNIVHVPPPAPALQPDAAAIEALKAGDIDDKIAKLKELAGGAKPQGEPAPTDASAAKGDPNMPSQQPAEQAGEGQPAPKPVEDPLG